MMLRLTGEPEKLTTTVHPVITLGLEVHSKESTGWIITDIQTAREAERKDMLG